MTPKKDMLWYPRPTKRSECLNNFRPCPWVSCKYHMLWAFSPPELKTMTDDELAEKAISFSDTCVLDVADREGATLQDVANILGISRERVRQIEGDSDKDYIITGISKIRRQPWKMRQLATAREQEY